MRGTYQNLKILDTAAYRVPRKFQKLSTGYRGNFRSWVRGTSQKFMGYRPEIIFWVPMGTGYRQNFQRYRPLKYQQKIAIK